MPLRRMGTPRSLQRFLAHTDTCRMISSGSARQRFNSLLWLVLAIYIYSACCVECIMTRSIDRASSWQPRAAYSIIRLIIFDLVCCLNESFDNTKQVYISASIATHVHIYIYTFMHIDICLQTTASSWIVAWLYYLYECACAVICSHAVAPWGNHQSYERWITVAAESWSLRMAYKLNFMEAIILVQYFRQCFFPQPSCAWRGSYSQG